MTQRNTNGEKTVLVLQGGGALGSYQAGAYAALAAGGQTPSWIAGISIGAINAALIAGNLPQNRVARLRQFWERLSSQLLAYPLGDDDVSRRMFNEASAAIVASTGVPGFFKPRVPPAMWMPSRTPEAISLYDTGPLHDTLLEFVDFKLLNDGPVRLSVGAVHVRTGNFRYFDTTKERLGPEHIMASGALPPGFAPVNIDGEPYWDGGIVSNTPLEYVLETPPRHDMCIFQIDVFNAMGDVPATLFDVAQREKEIRFSSRTRLNTDVARDKQLLRRVVARLEKKLPDSVKNTADWHFLAQSSCDASITIVHLINRRKDYTTQSGDYEFSRYTMNEHWDAGTSEVEKTLSDPRWVGREYPHGGVTILDVTREAPTGHIKGNGR